MENTNALSDMRYALGVWHFNEKLTNKANPCFFFYMSHLQTAYRLHCTGQHVYSKTQSVT